VRDIYPFRRSVSPQLNLVHMLPEKGQELIQKQVGYVSGLNLAVKATLCNLCTSPKRTHSIND
jgi:hypothetical protein